MTGVTWGSLITDALDEINANTPGIPSSAADMAKGLLRANMWLDSMDAQALMEFTERLDAYVMTPPKQAYTIGPTGADFTATRPNDIIQASIVDTTQTPNVFIGVTVVTADIWERYSVLGYQTSVPTQLWYQQTYPNGTINVRGIPNNATYQLRILTKQLLGQAASLATVFNFPPGYYAAAMYGVAESLCNPFGKVGDIKADITARARLARAAVKNANKQPNYMELDGLKTGKEKPYFNWITGPFLQ